VLLSPGHSLSGSGREHGRSIPFSEVDHFRIYFIPIARDVFHISSLDR
jgi:hypothetical protein